METSIDHDKINLINNASVFNLITLDTIALRQLFIIRKQYAKLFLDNGEDDYLELVEMCNRQIKQYLGL